MNAVGMRYRDVGLYSPLRPDFYEFFPNFSDFELLFRVDRLPFHLATLLGERNIIRSLELQPSLARSLRTFSRLDFNVQRQLFAEVMLSVGLSSRVCRALTRVRRELFIPESQRVLSYFNVTVPFHRSSWISNPGLVGLMLEAVSAIDADIREVIEVGIGSGYHAACTAELLGDVPIIGYEISPAFADFGISALRSAGYDRVTVMPERFDVQRYQGKSATLLYFTNRLATEHSAELIQRMAADQIAIWPMPLAAEEFAEAVVGGSFIRKYQSYEDYAHDPSVYLRLVTVRNKEISAFLYDVQFVPFRKNSMLVDTSAVATGSLLDAVIRVQR